MISGVTIGDLLHSGCRNNLQAGETRAAYFSAHSKSLLLKITTFNSLASGKISGRGALNFLGDKQIQSQEPLTGQAPEVSILVAKPAACRESVSASRLCINGSPPVTMAIRLANALAPATISSIDCNGCLPAS